MVTKTKVRIGKRGIEAVEIRHRIEREPGSEGIRQSREPEPYGGRGGNLQVRFRRQKGDAIPWRLVDRNHVMRIEAPRLLRAMRRNRGSVFTTGYEIPFTHGGTPVLRGRLRKSAYATAEGGELRYGWLAKYAYNLNYGYTLERTKRFKLPASAGGRTITLKKGHHVQGRRYLENNFARWFNGFQRRLRAHQRSGRPWREYK